MIEFPYKKNNETPNCDKLRGANLELYVGMIRYVAPSVSTSTPPTISTVGSNKEVCHLVSNCGSCKLPLSTRFVSLGSKECRSSSELEKDSSHGEEPTHY